MTNEPNREWIASITAGKKGRRRTAKGVHRQVVGPAGPSEIVEVHTASTVRTKRTRVEDPGPVVLEKPKLRKPKKNQTQFKQTETARLTSEFMRLLPHIMRRMMNKGEAHVDIGTPCDCDNVKLRDVCCRDCFQYRPSCRQCFINAHRNNPFHWADVWDFEQGFFRRMTLSMLGCPLSLGHNGSQCDSPQSRVSSFLVLADTGPQSVELLVCGHTTQAADDELPSRVAQLLDAGLFPCSFTEPKSAIAFSVLRRFEILHVESKVPAFDFYGALRRMSDNAFTVDVPDMFDNFIRSSRWWGVLKAQKRAGQAHGIDGFLTHRPKGNTILYCPSCPEPGFNMDNKLLKLPPDLRHLNQQRETIDGNFHCTKSTKNSDPNDDSLYQGSGFFPLDTDLKTHLDNNPPGKTEPRSNCNNLNAVNNQDKKKFKNMEITGIVNVQCSHVFVKASVDLQHGERYANVDFAFARSIRQKLSAKHKGDVEFTLQFDSVDLLMSYDAACQYSVGIVERFEKNFPDLVDVVKRMRWGVPALHIQAHKANCMYEFGMSYMVATGHFHGETAEHYWPELNQIGTQVTQQSGGHRQDTVSRAHNDWNFKKTCKAFLLLLADLRTAEATFEKHHKHFLGLCATYAQRIVEENWLKENREPDTSDPKFTTSVYRHSNVNVPTQKAIYERMLAQEGVVPNSATSMSKAAAFINNGILLRADQLKIRKLVSRLKVQFTETLKKDIDAQRTKLEESIVAWRRVQRLLLPDIDDFLGSRDACAVEDELLGLPSEVEEPARSALGLTPFVRIEGELREGAAFDAVAKVKVIAKALRALRDRKRKNDSGVYKNTIAQKQINDTQRRRDLHIARYMAAREALMTMRLAVGDETDFQELKPEHTYMKSRSMRRQLGDSRHTEGTIWTQASVSAGMRSTAPSVSVASAATAGPSTSAAPTVGTLMGRRKASARPSPTGKSREKPIAQSKKAPPAEGWIWSYKIGKMTDAQLDAWNNEGDRVQFFRAEAEMERWREQVEMKLAEWRTTVRSFAKYKEIWTKLAAIQNSSDVGFIAYAKEQAAIFARREAEGGTLLERHQSLSKYRVIEDPNLDLLNFVMERRKQNTATRDAILQEHSRKSASSEDDDETEEESSTEETESEEDEFEAEEELADVPSGDEGA